MIKMFRALFIVMILFGDLMGAIMDETEGIDHSQKIKEISKFEGWKLTISPFPESEPRLLLKRADETLNLTCKVQKLDSDAANISFSEQQFRLSWYLPNSLLEAQNRVKVIIFENLNTAQLTVTNLQDSDTGEYKCTAHEANGNPDTHAFIGALNVLVTPRKGLLLLGKGSPCDKIANINCTSRLISPCCNQLQSIQLSLDVSQYSPQPQQFNEITQLQTTIYTVIGCALGFMFVITILVIAICRVHLKRSAIARRQHNPFHHLRHFGLHGRDSGSWGSFSQQNAASGLLVAYNINNGLHFMGRPINPPPYSETMIRDPPPESPPPYASTDNLATQSISENPQGHAVVNIANENSNVIQHPINSAPTGEEEDTETMRPLLLQGLELKHVDSKS